MAHDDDLDLVDDLAAPWPFDDDAPPDDAPLAQIETVEVTRWLRRLRLIERRRAEVDEVAAIEMEAIESWRDKRRDVLDRAADWVRRSIEGWARAHHRDDPDTVTWKLPTGTVTLRDQQTKLVATDDLDAAGAARLDALGVPIATTYKVKAADAKKVLRPGEPTGPVDDDGFRPHAAVIDTVDENTGEVLSTVVEGITLMVGVTKRCNVNAVDVDPSRSPAPTVVDVGDIDPTPAPDVVAAALDDVEPW